MFERQFDVFLLSLGRTFYGRNILAHKNGLSRIDAPGHSRLDVLGADVHHIVKVGVLIAGKSAPALHRRVPILTFGRVGAIHQIFKRRFVRVDVTAACAAFDGHVAHSHALFHAHSVKDGAAVFVGVADAAVDAEFADDVQNHVLGVNTRLQFAVYIDAPHFGLAHRHCLRRQNVTHLARTDAKRNRAERAVGGSV